MCPVIVTISATLEFFMLFIVVGTLRVPSLQTKTLHTRRKSRRFGIWRNTSEHERHTQMPKSMKSDFDKAYDFYQTLKVELGVTDTAQRVTDTAQSVTHTAQQVLPSLFAGSGSKGS